MRYLKSFLYFLRNVPYKVGLPIVVACFLLFSILLIFGFPSPYDGTLFAIPVALAAWLYKQRGALICVGATLLLIGVVYPTRTNGLGPHSLLTVFLIGAISLSTEAFIIALLRILLDVADAALVKVQQAQQAEQLATLAYEQQRQLNELKDEFLLHVSHELRTPLTEVYGYLELLRARGGQLDPALQAKYLKNASQSCEDLLTQINSLLDTAEIANRPLSPNQEEVSVIQVVREVLSRFEPRQQQEHSLTLEIAEDLLVKADFQYTSQVLRNLLSNAFKFAPVNTAIVIRAALSEVDEQHLSAPYVSISVQDFGPGIPPEELPLLFGKFVRLRRDLAGSIPGSGLGLYITKQLVEVMGGSIRVESNGIEGQGSRFYFTLPSTTTSPMVPQTEKNASLVSKRNDNG